MDHRGLLRLARALDQLRDLDRITTALVFVNTITRQGVCSAELADDLGLTTSGISRNLANLTSLTWRKTPGLGLITHDYDHMFSFSFNHTEPTEKGVLLAAKLDRIIRP